MTTIRPLDDRVLLKPIDSEDKTPGGIILPDAAREKSTRGEVIAVGTGKLNRKDGTCRPLDLKVGDKVVYGKYAGTEIKIGSEKYMLMREDDVLAVFE